MSFLTSSFISDCQQELDIIGQRISDADFLLFINNANEYFSGLYYMPTREIESDIVLFPGVYEYAIPSDFGYLIELRRPYGLSSPRFSHMRMKDAVHGFDTGFSKSAIRFVRDTQYLFYEYTAESKVGIHDCQSLTDNGTVAVSGDGASLAVDEMIYTEGTGSLRFVVTASGGTTTITFTGMNTMDLSDIFDNGRFFLDLRAPSSNTANLTNVVLRIGNDASNYSSMTATTRKRGDALGTGWGLIEFDPVNKTDTGTVDQTAIDYAVVIITHGTSGVNGTYYLDNLFGANGTFFHLPYYSTYNVKNGSGTYQESVTATGDTVLVPPLFNVAFKYKVLMLACLQKLGKQAEATNFQAELERKEKALKARYPQQTSLPQTFWYRRSKFF